MQIQHLVVRFCVFWMTRPTQGPQRLGSECILRRLTCSLGWMESQAHDEICQADMLILHLQIQAEVQYRQMTSQLATGCRRRLIIARLQVSMTMRSLAAVGHLRQSRRAAVQHFLARHETDIHIPCGPAATSSSSSGVSAFSTSASAIHNLEVVRKEKTDNKCSTFAQSSGAGATPIRKWSLGAHRARVFAKS